MMTIRKSPAAELREHFAALGHAAPTRAARQRVDDYFPFGCGDRVCRVDDPRHAGRVYAVVSNSVRVEWDDTGWREEEIDPRDLEKTDA